MLSWRLLCLLALRLKSHVASDGGISAQSKVETGAAILPLYAGGGSREPLQPSYPSVDDPFARLQHGEIRNGSGLQQGRSGGSARSIRVLLR